MRNIGARFRTEKGKSEFLQITAQGCPPQPFSQTCRVANEQVHADPAVDADEEPPLRIIGVAIALQIGEGRPCDDRKMANTRPPLPGRTAPTPRRPPPT